MSLLYFSFRFYVVTLQAMKKYWISIVVLLLLAVILIFNTKDKSSDVETIPSVSEVIESEDTGVKEGCSVYNYDFDIPLPLEGVPEQILHRKGYVASYNKDNRIPNWVAWKLTAEHVGGKVKRPGNAWHEDDDVPLPRATRHDYKGSHWSRGHMCPAGDNKWDSEAMYQTFMFSNCCPQNSNLNSGTWNQIEISCRRWAEEYGEVYIVCGPILYNQEHETIGENNVVVPEAFFKVVVCLSKGREKGIGFVCKNTDGNRRKDFYVNSIKDVERITGITFFPHLAQDVKDKIKNNADLEDW